MNRRRLLRWVGAVLVAGAAGCIAPREKKRMYGLIGKILAADGQRDALAAILIEGCSAMPGCLSYVVAADPSDPDALWVTEVWESRALHDASLGLPSVRRAIASGKPLIARFGDRLETEPIGGHGLVSV